MRFNIQKWCFLPDCRSRYAPEKSEEYDPVGALGVDLGIKNIAVDSDRQIFESKKVEKARQHYNKQRSILQKVGTKSAEKTKENIW